MSCILLGDYESISRLNIPMFLERVSAGFPSPAEDYVEKTIDLNELCIQHPAATFFVRVQGESMIEAGILDGDTVVIEQREVADDGEIVVALIDGEEATLKRLRYQRDGSIALIAANPAMPPMIYPAERVAIQGVVVGQLRSYR